MLPETNENIPLSYAEKRMNERGKERDERKFMSSLSPPLPLISPLARSWGWNGGDEADDDVGSDAAADSAADLIAELRTALLCHCQRSGQVTLSETASDFYFLLSFVLPTINGHKAPLFAKFCCRSEEARHRRC